MQSNTWHLTYGSKGVLIALDSCSTIQLERRSITCVRVHVKRNVKQIFRRRGTVFRDKVVTHLALCQCFKRCKYISHTIQHENIITVSMNHY